MTDRISYVSYLLSIIVNRNCTRVKKYRKETSQKKEDGISSGMYIYKRRGGLRMTRIDF